MKLLIVVIGFVAGTALAFGYGADVPPTAVALFAAAALFAALLLTRLHRSPWLMLAVLAAALGMLRVLIGGGEAETLLLASRQTQEVEGVALADERTAGGFSRFRLRVDSIRSVGGEWQPAHTTLLVAVRPDSEIAQHRQPPYFRYGDRLRLRGRIDEPPTLEDFDYAAYLARQGISEVMDAQQATLVSEGEGSAFYHRLFDLRRRMASAIAVAVPEPQAALGQAMLLGLRRNMPADLTEAFRRSGTSHLLAISGLHVGILLTASLSAGALLLGRKRYLHLILPLVVIWMYGLMSGMSPSAVRACIMGSVYLATLAFGRQRGVLAPLGCAAAVMVAVSPEIIFSISFQLSFAAMAGIAVFADGFGGMLRAAVLHFGGRSSALRAVLATTSDMVGVAIAATVTTLPLIAYHFDMVSTLGVPASLLTLPAVPLIIIGSAGAGILGLLNDTLALPFGWVVWASGGYVSGVVTLLASLPNAAIHIGGLPPLLLAAYYLILAVLYAPSLIIPHSLRSIRSRLGLRGLPDSVPFGYGGAAAWLLVPAAFTASLVWTDVLARDDRLHIVFVDVGQGDGVFIETPGGRQIIVDGGADPLLMTQFLGRRLHFNDRQIDIVAATHYHSDHITGLTQVLERYDVKGIIERRMDYDSASYQAWRQAVQNEGATNIEAQAGQVITLDSGVRLETLFPPPTLLSGTESDANNASLVLRLVYGDMSFLFTGDIYSDAEQALVAQNAHHGSLKSDVLKVPHHGSDSSSTQAFLSAVSPTAAVISVDADNRFGHPSQTVVDRLHKIIPSDNLFLTAEDGTIEFITDGRTLQVRTQR